MSETEFKATLQMLIPMIIEKMEESYQLDEETAIRELYNSKLYSDLERETTKLWHLSPLCQSQLWYEGKTTGTIKYPEET